MENFLKSFFCGLATEACIRLECGCFDSSLSIPCITAWSQCEAKGVCASASAGTGSCEDFSKLIANACSIVSTGSCSCVSAPGFLFNVQNEGFVAPCRMRTGLDAVGVIF